MDEQVSWKGHSFMLLVFGGIVFLCSIFFVLGMLVGRGQGKSAAESAAVTTAAKVADAEARAQEAKSALSPYTGIETGKEINKESKPDTERKSDPPQASTPAPDKPAKPAPKAAPAPAPAPPKAVPAKSVAPSPAKMIYLQVNAVGKDTAANKQAEELRKAGFQVVVMGGDGSNALYKVQVGPFATVADADSAKRKLEALGFKPIRK